MRFCLGNEIKRGIVYYGDEKEILKNLGEENFKAWKHFETMQESADAYEAYERTLTPIERFR